MDSLILSAEGAVLDVPRDESRQRLRRRAGPHQMRKYKELKVAYQRLRLHFALCAAGLVTLSVGFGAWALHVTHSHRELSTAHFRQRAALTQAEATAQQASQELAALVQGRIPNLYPVALDQVIPVGRHYVKNVAFAQLREGGVPSYEFKLLLENDTEAMAIPHVRLLLFDRLGVEIGRAVVAASEGESADAEILYPGTARSYGGSFALPRDAEPVYFLLDVADAARAAG
jgi:hypothetical protein